MILIFILYRSKPHNNIHKIENIKEIVREKEKNNFI